MTKALAFRSPGTQLLTLFFLLAFSGGLFAQATLSVQGVLTKSDGTAVDDGQYPITFRLWTAESGGNMVHEETIQQVETTGGVYSALLGANGFNANATFSQVYYLGVSVNGGAELAPRPRLTHAPYTLSVIGSSNKFTSSGPVEADGYKANNGTPAIGVAGTGYSFRGNGSNSDQDGGLFSYADDQVSLYTNAQERIKVTGGQTEVKNPFYGYGKVHSNSGFFLHNNGSSTDVGMYSPNGSSVGLYTGSGVDRIIAFSDGNNYYKTTGSHVFQTGNVQVDNTLSISGTTNLNGTVSTTGSKITVNKPMEFTGTEINFPINNGGGTSGILFSNGAGTSSLGSQYPALVRINGITIGQFFYATSDRRIKKDFSHPDRAEALAKLKKLQVTDYLYIDEITHGRGMKKGFIAQEVEEIEPGAVNVSTGFIPSIYASAEKISATGQQVIFTMAKPHGLLKGERVRIFDGGKQQQDLVVIAATETEFTVEKWGAPAPTGAFVFGKEVNDFRAVEYDHIFTMNVAATQELARQVEEVKNENANLRAKLESQSAAIGDLAKRMNLMESNGATGLRK